MRLTNPAETVVADLRYACRTLRRSPAFAAGAVLTLALGIGANVAVFAFVNSLLFGRLPYPEPDRLFAVQDRFPAASDAPIPLSYPNFADWQARQHVFAATAVYRETPAVVAGGGAPERVQAALISPALFDALGVRPAHGRTFRADEERGGGVPVVIIGHALWQRRFAGEAAVGRSLTVDDVSRVVVGVMPAGFDFPDAAEVWLPGDANPAEYPRGRHAFECVARLRPGVEARAAAAEMRRLARELAAEHPYDNEGMDTVLQPLRGTLVPARAALGFSLLMGAVAFVLLIACANLANLMLGRAAARGHEIALRSALGASRWRLLRQLLTESSALAASGAALGLAAGFLGRDALVALIPVELPTWLTFEIDGRVATLAVLLAVLATAAFGLAPALRASRGALAPDLRSRQTGLGGPRDRLRSALILSEVALASALLMGGGLMLRALSSVLAVDPGVRAAGVWSARLALPSARYPTADEQRLFYERVVEQVRALPGVRSASAVSSLPMSGSYSELGVSLEGRPARSGREELLTFVCTALPDYFQTMGIRLVRGRVFTALDGRPGTTPVAVVSEAFARRYLPPGDPVGARVALGSGSGSEPWMTIVGVVADVRHVSLELPAAPVLFVPYGQRPSPSMTMVVRSATSPLSLSEPIRRIVGRLDPDRPLFAIRTMEQVVARSIWPSRFFAWLLASFGALALLLATAGVYSVISYAIMQRTGEIGLRLALGAGKGDIHWLVARQALVPTVGGLVIGLAGAVFVARGLGGWLHGVSPADGRTYAAVALAIVLTAVAACYLPSRRAAKMDPMTTLRGQ